jgi:hypothetical protein
MTALPAHRQTCSSAVASLFFLTRTEEELILIVNIAKGLHIRILTSCAAKWNIPPCPINGWNQHSSKRTVIVASEKLAKAYLGSQRIEWL